MENTALITETTETKMAKISIKEKFAYAMGDVGQNFVYDLGQIYLLKYFTDVLGLPAAVAGTIFLITKLFDAGVDVGIGTWLEARKNFGPRGKFRPFMLYGAIPLGLFSIACFSNPGTTVSAKLVLAYLSYMGFGLFFSLINIPYSSMGAAMTQDPSERTSLAAWRQGGSNTGLLISTVAYMPIVLLFSNAHTGYIVATCVFTLLGVLGIWYSYAGIKERVIVEKPKDYRVTFGNSYKLAFKNMPLIMLCIANLFTFSAFNVKLAVQVYYCQYVLQNISILPYIGFFSIGCVFLGVALVPFVVKRIGKKYGYMFGCGIWAVGDILNYLISPDVFGFIFLTCVAFFGSAFVNSLNWACIADAVEYGEWKTGFRSEGVIYSSFAFFRKLSQSMAGFVPGVVLTMIGYVPNAVQSASAIAGIRGLMFIYPAFFAIMTVVAFGALYPLTEKRYKEILVELNERKKTGNIAI